MNIEPLPLSATGKQWKVSSWIADETIVLEDGTPVPDEIVSIIKGRGVEDVSAWLKPDLEKFMPNPLLIPRLKEAAHRICEAVRSGEKVALYGDYDVDGATSVAQVSRWFCAAGAPKPRIYIPDRLTEGYGPNEKAMEKLKSEGIGLLIVQDSGTAALAPLSHAHSLGMDIVVIDHHEPREDGLLPPGIVVNPKLEDTLHLNMTYLCTAGLTFLVLVACNRMMIDSGWFREKELPVPDIKRLLGLVALGTVADVVPLVKLNRAYVARGLLYASDNPGLNALMGVTDRGDLTAYNCGFVWGPCINAGGRLGDTSQGARLLSGDDEDECLALALSLRDMNEERKGVQSAIVDKVYETIENNGGTGRPDEVLVVHVPDAHPGVIGIAAGKVKERMDRSVVVIGQGGKGSARAVVGYNMGQYFLKAAEDGLLVKGGGHAAAAGLTIDTDKIEEFRLFLNSTSRGLVRPPLKVELERHIDDISISLVRKFGLLAPFGMGNPGVSVLLTGGHVSNVQRNKGRHIKCLLKGEKSTVTIMFWHGIGTELGDLILAADGRSADFVGKLKAGFYAGRDYVEMDPVDIRFTDSVLL